MEKSVLVSPRRIAIIGNPNCGKTTIFNRLTGLRQKVANYPGVTVEKKEGTITFADGSEATLLDLPGTYSLNANAPDEKIAADVLLGRLDGMYSPDMVICVVDAANIERNLYMVSQIIDLQIPTILVLNMVDAAEKQGVHIDSSKLSKELGIQVIATVGSKGSGIGELKAAINGEVVPSTRAREWEMQGVLLEEYNELNDMLLKLNLSEPLAFHETVTLLSSPNNLDSHSPRIAPEIIAHVMKDHMNLSSHGIDCETVFIESRYEWIKKVCDEAVVNNPDGSVSFSDRIDRILTHKVWGFVVFIGLMTVIFQAIFSWAQIPMELISSAFDFIGVQITQLMPKGDLQDLIVNGGLAGVGAVVIFLPQILFLFLFIGLLEDTGYMARAAFIMDRLMSKVGLHGKSFIPMLSSFACAIPGIMATRTIESRKDRLVTMLVAPLVSCSARLPVYALMIAAFIPNQKVFGILSLPALTFVSIYLLGLVVAMAMAWLFKKTLLKSETPTFIMELPPYKMPDFKSILMQMWERGVLFLQRAGTIILGVSIVLWFLATYPRNEGATPSEHIRHSFAGQAGRFIEPVIKPLGFDWKIGIGLVTSLLQREVFVSTMGTIYNINDADAGDGSVSIRQHMQDDVDPVTGAHTFTLLTAICIMVYYALSMQCMSTVAVMRRETNGWKWPAFQFGYMTLLAYGFTFAVYRVGLLLG